MSLQVIHKDQDRQVALVKADGSKQSIPVVMAEWLRYLVCVGDLAIIKKNHVTGELMLTDYVIVIDEVGGLDE